MKRIYQFLFISMTVLSCVDQPSPPVTEVPFPVIDSVSQGVFDNFIQITWHTDSTTIARYEIYRASLESGPYELITVVDASPGLNIFRDSIKINSVFFYKIAGTDPKGRSSKMSASAHGFIRSVPVPPVLRIEEYADFVALFWSPSSEGNEYAVYRSSEGCTTGMTRIARTSLTAFFDSATFSGISYYTIGALNNKGHDIYTSNCAWGGLSRLPAPGGCRIANDTASYSVLLTWDSVPGAHEYVLYRSFSYCPKANEEFIRTKSRSIQDTLIKPGYVYYAVAAVDNAKRVSAMSACVRSSISRLSPPENVKASYDEIPRLVVLSWNVLEGAHHYTIYRSTASCFSKMEKIDSTTVLPAYRDSVPTSEPCSYSVAGVDSLGVEGLQSACVQGRVKLLPAPINFKATNGLYAHKVRVSWDSVPGANGYIYYRGNSNVFEKSIPIDTVTSLYDFDSVVSTSLRYYWVAARDRLGPGKLSGYVWGRTLMPPQSTVIAFNESSVTLACETDTTALEMKYLYSFFIDEDDFRCIDSTTGSFFIEKPTDYSVQKYRLLIKTAVGDSMFSDIVQGSTFIPAPAGLKATGSIDGVSLEWNSIPGIEKYLVFKADSLSDSTIFLGYAYDTSFIDLEITASRCQYQVAADNGLVTSKKSDPIIGSRIASVGLQWRRPQQ
jgi:hypothetical protein